MRGASGHIQRSVYRQMFYMPIGRPKYIPGRADSAGLYMSVGGVFHAGQTRKP